MPVSHAEALYVLVDGSLPAGDKMAQAAHAVAAWCIDNPTLAARWRNISEYLIILETPYRNHGDALTKIQHAAEHEVGIGHTAYREPDLDDAVTAIAFNPSADTRKLLASFPLAGRAEKRLAIIKDIMRLDIANDGIYEDEETGVIDLEWRSDHGYAHLQMGETRYAMYVTNKEDAAHPTQYFNGRVRDLLAEWDAISTTLNSMLYPTSTEETGR